MKNLIRKILIWLNLFLAFLLIISYLANYISPAFIWPIAFFGLAYPFLLGMNVLFVIFWVLLRKGIALISVLTILLGWGYVGRFIQIRLAGEDSTTNADINLLSYNIHSFNNYPWEEETRVGDSIIQYLLNSRANMLCFQEYLTMDSPGRFDKNSLDTFLTEFPYRHEYFTYNSVPEWSSGVATYSKLPIIRKGSLHFENSFNSSSYSDVILGSDTIRIFNVHLQSIKLKKNSYTIMDDPIKKIDQKRLNEIKDITNRLKTAYIKRARQVDEVSRLIRRSPYPVIVCGDFNDTPVSYTYHKIRGDLNDAFLHSGKGLSNTYRGKFPSFRIDFIFYSNNFEALGYQRDMVTYSDHFPVSCQLNIK